MATRVVTGMKPWTIYLWLLVVVAGGAVTLYRDLNGTGLAQGMYYRSLGNAVYLVFYGSVACAIYWLTGMLSVSDRYLRVTDDRLVIGRAKAVGRDEVLSLSVERNWLGLKELRFRFRNGGKKAIRSYVLARPVEEVCAALEGWRRPGSRAAS